METLHINIDSTLSHVVTSFVGSSLLGDIDVEVTVTRPSNFFLAEAWARESSKLGGHRMRISWDIICEYLRYKCL